MLDVCPVKDKRFDQLTIGGFHRLMERETSMVEEIIRRADYKPISVSFLGQQLGWRPEKVQRIIPDLLKKETIVAIPSGQQELYLHQENLQFFENKIKQVVEDFFT